MFRYRRPNPTLTLLPCTMQDGVFVTTVKWKIHGSLWRDEYMYSPEIILHDTIKDEPVKIQLRLTNQPQSEFKVKPYLLEYWHDNGWKWYSYEEDDKEYTVYLWNNIYYGSKTLETDLREYLAANHGETFTFGEETHSVQKCSKEVLFAYIDQEHNEDFVIECEGNEFKIKKIILRARSPVFYNMLSSDYFKEARENRMVIIDYGSKTVGKMVEFFQTDFIQDTTKCEIELFKIARKYMSPSFMEITRLPFVQKLSIATYDEFLKLARKHEDKKTEKLLNEWYEETQNHQDPKTEDVDKETGKLMEEWYEETQSFRYTKTQNGRFSKIQNNDKETGKLLEIRKPKTHDGRKPKNKDHRR